jgi:hypothetical protein
LEIALPNEGVCPVRTTWDSKGILEHWISLMHRIEHVSAGGRLHLSRRLKAFAPANRQQAEIC